MGQVVSRKSFLNSTLVFFAGGKTVGGKMSRTKGHAFEREIAKAFRRIFPKAGRQLEYQLNNCNGIDLANTGVYQVQCKRFKKYASLSCIEEIKPPEGWGNPIPVLITKADNKPALACLPLEHLLDLISVSEAVFGSES